MGLTRAESFRAFFVREVSPIHDAGNAVPK